MSKSVPIDLKLRQDIIDCMVNVVENSTVDSAPFPHALFPGFFPEDVYTTLLENFPPTEIYEPYRYEKWSNEDGSTRTRFRLENELMNQMDESKQSLWYTIRSSLGSIELKESVFDLLQDGLAYRFKCPPDEAKTQCGYSKPELFREIKGYRIKPHPDTRRKVVTMQIALPEDESQKEIGTEFYKRSLNPGAWLRIPKGFDVVKTMPFVPNQAYVFVVLNTIGLKSWHGRSALAETSSTRNSILNLYYHDPEDGNPEIQAENTALRSLEKHAA